MEVRQKESLQRVAEIKALLSDAKDAWGIVLFASCAKGKSGKERETFMLDAILRTIDEIFDGVFLQTVFIRTLAAGSMKSLKVNCRNNNEGESD